MDETLLALPILRTIFFGGAVIANPKSPGFDRSPPPFDGWFDIDSFLETGKESSMQEPFFVSYEFYAFENHYLMYIFRKKGSDFDFMNI